MPRRTEGRTKMIGLLLSANERALLDELAAEAEMTMSAYLRLLIKKADRERKTIQLPRKAKQHVEEYA
jgi:hypothetical protein